MNTQCELAPIDLDAFHFDSYSPLITYKFFDQIPLTGKKHSKADDTLETGNVLCLFTMYLLQRFQRMTLSYPV